MVCTSLGLLVQHISHGRVFSTGTTLCLIMTKLKWIKPRIDNTVSKQTYPSRKRGNFCTTLHYAPRDHFISTRFNHEDGGSNEASIPSRSCCPKECVNLPTAFQRRPNVLFGKNFTLKKSFSLPFPDFSRHLHRFSFGYDAQLCCGSSSGGPK